MLKGLSGLMQVMKQAQAIQGRVGEIQQKLNDLRAEGSAGGGMVVAEVNGQQRLLSCRLEPQLLQGGDRELIEELVVSAVNQALDRSKEAAARAMSGMVDGLAGVDLNEALAGLDFTGGAR